METPLSSRRLTRSHTQSTQNSANRDNFPVSVKCDDSEMLISKSSQRNGRQQQTALIDITNDSPIVGLAMGNLETPSSTTTKGKFRNIMIKNTPGSGEALLRDQVKNLLQKVEEEAEFSKLSSDNRLIIHLKGFVNSPMILAPTPANTPQIPNLSGDSNKIIGLDASPIVEEIVKISEVVVWLDREEVEYQKSVGITRSLLMDFSEKSESPDSSKCSSILTYERVLAGEEIDVLEKSSDFEDDSSLWSIQVNASSTHDEEEDEEKKEDEDECYYNEDCEEEEFDSNGGLLVDELCEGMDSMSVKEEKNTSMAKFIGKRIKFVYSSDDEIVEDVEEENGGCP